MRKKGDFSNYPWGFRKLINSETIPLDHTRKILI